MSSQARTREEERRFNVRTLVFASIGAAVAAIVTSQFWIAGTPIAAAMTPVIVALVSEMLHRPTERIAQKLTTETDALPESAGAAPPPDEPGPPARDVTIYTSQKQDRDLPWGKILATGAIAFVIGVGILTLPELISGQSLGKGDGSTSILGNNRDRDNGDEAPAEQQETVTETVPAEPQPQTTPQTPEPATPPATTAPQPQQQTTPTTPTTPTP